MKMRAVVGGINASRWGWIAVGATVLSAIGYAVQTVLDYVSEPAIVGEIEFYGLFGGFGVAALFAGVVAVATGWQRRDQTVRLGLIAVAYAALAQLIQSLWD